MPKKPHTNLAEHLTADVVDHHIATGKPIRLHDRDCVGLYAIGPDKFGRWAWWFMSAANGTPCLGPLDKLDLADARQRAATLGPPSAKAVKLIASASQAITTTPPYDPEARRLEAMNALVSELVEARWTAMKPKIASFIRDEISKAVKART